MSVVAIPIDRSMVVPHNKRVRSGYVAVHNVRFACHDRMAVGDVERAYQKLLPLGEDSPWPPPRGHWEGETFVLVDGRHEYIAALMLGRQHILVAWIDD